MILEVSGFMDELKGNADFRGQLDQAKKLGMRTTDLRFLDLPKAGGGEERINIMDLELPRVREVASILDGEGLKLGGLGLGVGKRLKFNTEAAVPGLGLDAIPGMKINDYIDQEIKPLAEALEALGNPGVRIFAGNRRPSTNFDNQIVDNVGHVVNALLAIGAKVVELEHEPFTGAADPRESIIIADQLKIPGLKLIFDEGNAMLVGYKNGVDRLLSVVTDMLPHLGAVHLKRLNPNDPNLNEKGWTAENAVCGFSVVGGPVYEGLFAAIKTLLHQESNIRAVLEPHMDHSAGTFGLTSPHNFNSATDAFVGMSRRYGIPTDLKHG